MFIFTVDMGSKTGVRLYTRISRALALLSFTISNHQRSQERGQALEEGQAETHPEPQPVAQEEQPQEQLLEENVRDKDTGSENKQTGKQREVPEDDGNSDVGEEYLPTTEEIEFGLTRSLGRAAEERGEYKIVQVLSEDEDGTSSQLTWVDITSYSQL
jgi:hypothetical protein